MSSLLVRGSSPPKVIPTRLTLFDSSVGCGRRFVVYVYCVLLCNSLTAVAKNIKIHGFVTNISSQNSFEIDDYRITKEITVELEVEKDDSGSASATFKPEDIHVGTELEIKGEYNDQQETCLRSRLMSFWKTPERLSELLFSRRCPHRIKLLVAGAEHCLLTASGS